jgi:hypothetical protein
MPVGFVAYIDESGDPGLRRVQPRTPGGASEWFVLSCVLVRIEHDSNVLLWVKNLVSAPNSQRAYLHFRDLSPAKKRQVCETIGEKPLRCFVAMSNKKNMEGHRNDRPFPEPNWFYQWMTRILLERVTEFCQAVNEQSAQEPKTLRVVFSRRGGLSLHRLRQYLGLVKFQGETNSLYINTKKLSGSVLDPKEFRIFDHKMRAGLQLADAVASAFYQAVTLDKEGACDPQFAKLLRPTMYHRRKRFIENGIKPFPTLRQMDLAPAQREIFEFYGFPKTGW